MDSLKKPIKVSISDPSCFFCIMKEQQNSSTSKTSKISKYFKQMSLKEDDPEQVLVLSTIWNMAMVKPDEPELPLSGVFECMASFINKSIHNKKWLLKDQNIYIPYYAAHVIGSYTMNNEEFAKKAVKSGVIPPLIELLKGKITWVEQRVALRALGHLASYETTFEDVAKHENEIVSLAMRIASTCLDVVYVEFVNVEDKSGSKILKYQRNLLTRRGLEIETVKAEEWGSQLQCWSIYLLNCFASKRRCLEVICANDFLRDLSKMWGGVMNHSSPFGVGLIRIICYTEKGRRFVADSKEVVKNICNLSRSSDEWQYIGIDCLLLLLKDQETRYKVIEIASLCLIDLIEIKKLNDRRSNVGERITRSLLSSHYSSKTQKDRIFTKNVNKVTQTILRDIWKLKVERRKKERFMCEEQVEEKRVFICLLKQQANQMFRLRDIEEAIKLYGEAIEVCPLKFRKDRMVLYSNRAECYLLMKNADGAIKDATRALSLAKPVNSHCKSLWRRSQAYDMKGLGKESLLDCIMFINGCINSSNDGKRKKKSRMPRRE